MRCAGVGVNVGSVAPGIGLPAAYHCSFSSAEGVQLPALARSVSPTAASPVIVGCSTASTSRSLKWMNPVGQ